MIFPFPIVSGKIKAKPVILTMILTMNSMGFIGTNGDLDHDFDGLWMFMVDILNDDFDYKFYEFDEFYEFYGLW